MLHGWQYLKSEDREVILAGIACGQALGGPFHLEIDWVDACNASCFFCNSDHLHGGAVLGWPRTQEVLEQALTNDLRCVRLSGGGEPLLHPRIDRMLAWLGERGVSLDNLNTNGVLLDAAVVSGLADIHVGEVKVSLNYCDAKAYSRGAGIPERIFGRVCDNIRGLHEARCGSGGPEVIEVQFFVYADTARDIVRMYELGCSLGANRISFRDLFGIHRDLALGDECAQIILPQVREVLRRDITKQRAVFLLYSQPALQNQIAELELEIQGDRGGKEETRQPAGDHQRYCFMGWYSMTLTGTENVYPCCYFLPSRSRKPLDTLRTRTLHEVWSGPRYARFRSEMWDYIVSGVPSANAGTRTSTIMQCCNSHTDCPLGGWLADDEMYLAAHSELEPVRRIRRGDQSTCR